ncbi:hypothetical protein DEJ50_13360 [Streptomyces venezuelae]|uniref:Uncharacterized protein n=1 Tax=Streptomyces venezuelae TaxID=54571 RepID=A0A5P2D398_STRVZ|nr:hypothetical protein [Streptomyces venezuelae]QES48667.1 hypothetical protein DEJ50_13360 [Streptomyces venezuelae]
MGILDTYLGTRRPAGGVAPLPALELRSALLALNGPGVPFTVRNGTAKEGDLVAECRLPQLRVRLQTRMRLDAAKREVRALDERWENSSGAQALGEYSRGPANAVYRVWEKQQGPDGRERRVEAFRFETRELKDPLRQTVLAAGWTWRGVLFRL